MGGKNVHAGMVRDVRSFAEEFLSKAHELGFSRHLAYFDQNYPSAEK